MCAVCLRALDAELAALGKVAQRHSVPEDKKQTIIESRMSALQHTVCILSPIDLRTPMGCNKAVLYHTQGGDALVCAITLVDVGRPGFRER